MAMGIVAESAGTVKEAGRHKVAPRHFWVVAWVSLLWNGFGVVDHALTILRNPGYMAHFPAQMGNWLDAMPPTVHFLWAMGVWGSLAGSVLMLLRRRQAGLAFMLSFIAAAGSYSWQFSQTLPAGFNAFGLHMMALVILSVIFGLWWYVRSMFWHGVLK